MKKAGLASVVISLTACGGGGQTSGAGTTSTAAPENVQAGASCERIVDAVMRWTASQEEMSVAELEARRPDLRASGVARCSDHADEQPFACIGAALDDERAIDACLRQGLAAYGEGYKSEAEVQLTRLGKALKATFIETGGYEVGAVGLTPSASCCSVGGLCQPDAAVWAAGPWAALEFAIDDPHMFQYSYAGDATGFMATAVGDQNCDGTSVTYVLKGRVDGGAPTLEPIIQVGED